MGRQFHKSTEDGGDYILPPDGSAFSVLTVLAYLGRHESTWQGETRTRELIGLSYELAERAEDGRALAVNEVMTASNHEKSKFYSRVLALTGGREPPNGFDVAKLLGRGAIITVVHVQKDGKTYANVTQAGPLPRGMQPPTPSVEPIYFDIETGDDTHLQSLPARFRKLVEVARGAPATRHDANMAMQAPPAQPQARPAPAAAPAPAPAPQAPAQPAPAAADVPFDDDIPF